jgi:chemotaxis signal transduction protein
MIAVEHRARPSFQEPWSRSAQECVVFALRTQTYAVSASRLRTCLSLPRLTALDDTPPYLLGAFDLRGELTPVVSPVLLDGAVMTPAGSGDLLIVVDAGAYPLALHADSLLGIESLRTPSAQARLRAVGALSSVRVTLSGGAACMIDPARIELVAAPGGVQAASADERLGQFEAGLDAEALALLETRAERYRGLAPAVSPERTRGWGRAASGP